MTRTVLLLALGTVAGCTEPSADAPTGTDTEVAPGSTADPTEADTSSSSGGEAESSSTTVASETDTDTDTEGPSTTTGPECSEDVPCDDAAAAAFCVDGSCRTCDAVMEGTSDEACAMLDETLPLCVGDACMQCTFESPEACGGTTPLCDAEANTCVGCRFHEECVATGSPACNIATGACFDAANVTMVDLSEADALQDAVNGVANGAERALVITGSGSASHTVTIDGGKTIAIVSSNTSIQEIRGAGDAPELTVSGPGTTVFLHRVWFSINLQGVGISVENEAHLYADSSRIAPLFSEGGITLAAGTSGFIRNSMVGGAVDVAALDASSATVELLYSSILGSAGDADGFICSSGININIRNSIITTRGATPALGCAGADVSNTAVENTGMTSWFADYNSGDAHLEPTGQTQFADIAIWETGDPPFDFEGDPRPTADGDPDYAGADTIP